ncbi:hypothetical protein C8Q77DRAFT_263655 [Trametes polyzona]|nr:hypothetical protein C8Q77DRAFT_263655 [Trametes polyzona]
MSTVRPRPWCVACNPDPLLAGKPPSVPPPFSSENRRPRVSQLSFLVNPTRCLLLQRLARLNPSGLDRDQPYQSAIGCPRSAFHFACVSLPLLCLDFGRRLLATVACSTTPGVTICAYAMHTIPVVQELGLTRPNVRVRPEDEIPIGETIRVYRARSPNAHRVTRMARRWDTMRASMKSHNSACAVFTIRSDFEDHLRSLYAV